MLRKRDYVMFNSEMAKIDEIMNLWEEMTVKWPIFIGNDFTLEHRIGAFPTSFSQPIFDQKINFRKLGIFQLKSELGSFYSKL